jgi:hypothetical protein
MGLRAGSREDSLLASPTFLLGSLRVERVMVGP